MSVANSDQQPHDITGETSHAVGQTHQKNARTPGKKKVRRPRIPRVGETLTQSGTPSASGWASCVPLGAMESALRKAVVDTTILDKAAAAAPGAVPQTPIVALIGGS